MKVVCGMDGEHADTSHWGAANVLVQGNFCGGGVPGDEPVPKKRRLRIGARLNGLENASKEGEGCSSLQRNMEQSRYVQKFIHRACSARPSRKAVGQVGPQQSQVLPPTHQIQSRRWHRLVSGVFID